MWINVAEIHTNTTMAAAETGTIIAKAPKRLRSALVSDASPVLMPTRRCHRRKNNPRHLPIFDTQQHRSILLVVDLHKPRTETVTFTAMYEQGV